MRQQLQQLSNRFLSQSAKRRLIKLLRWPPVGFVYKGSFRRKTPISNVWGFDRGIPVDRYYIDRFLTQYQRDIKGRVLEIGTNRFTLQYGGSAVTESVVLHVAEQKEFVTVIADLTEPNSLPKESFDCIILTQTLNAIFDLETAIGNVYASLKPGGVALVTVPGISKICRYDMDRWGYYWAFTTLSIEKLFARHFPTSNLTIASHGNVLASASFLYGLSHTELNHRQLEHHDPDFQLLITLRAEKPAIP